ncbi:hypothetical protein E2C01_028286 [Portunus trituberculatus]|uniref:Neurotransmitter-gated ion-channel ligand-binding domain-containing protein n=1 Tax=Portunus trituberculatus TaxID=210409 RepID=A0A5B7EPL8_PORTR|nr:hypothetical protein [Portunus trituberculatus]
MDCDDKSDEDCYNRVLVPQQYLILPPVLNPTSPLTLLCNIEVINYRSFSIKEMELVVDLNIVFQWKDERLKFLYLNDKPAPIHHMLKDIWIPKFDVTSGIGIRADIEEGKKILTAKPVNSAEPDDLSSLNGGSQGFLPSQIPMTLSKADLTG